MTPSMHLSAIDLTPKQERAIEQERWEQEDRLREAIADMMHNERGSSILLISARSSMRSWNKLVRQPCEPEWQTKTPVPIPALGRAYYQPLCRRR